MTIEEQLKMEILKRYKSVRAFTISQEIPYSTLDSVFKRGISKAGIETMLKIFSALDLDIESIASGTLRAREVQSETKLDRFMDLSSDAYDMAVAYDKASMKDKETVKMILSDVASHYGNRFFSPPASTKIVFQDVEKDYYNRDD